jgi:Restriction endonuclease S subunits
MERYEEYKDSGVEWIGEIPRGWGAAAAKRWARISNGSNPTTNGNTPVYGSSGVAFKTCGESKQAPAVLLGRKGTIGSPSYIDHPYWNVDTAFDVKTDEEVLKLRYYFYLATCFDYARYQTNTTVPSMTQTDYEDMIIPLPSVIEQQAIAGYLDAKTVEIDALVADCERAVDLLREYRKAVISEAVTKGLNPDALMKDSGVEWIGKIPESWHAAPLKHMVASIESGTSLDGANWPASDDEKGVLTLSSVYQSRFDASCNKAVSPELYERLSCPLKNGTLLISRCNTSEWVGTAAYVHDAPDNLFLPDKLWQLSFTSDFNCRYIQYALQANVARNYFAALSVGASSTMQNIAKPDLLAAPIAIPDENEITVVVDYLDTKTTETDALIQAKQSMIDKLREYRRSLISEAVTGKFKVPGI